MIIRVKTARFTVIWGFDDFCKASGKELPDENFIFSLHVHKAMPNWNSVKRQLKLDKPRYLFTKTHKPKTKTHLFYDKNKTLYKYI